VLGPSTCLAVGVPGSVCRARSTVHSECCFLRHIAVALTKLRRRVMFRSRVLPAKLNLDTYSTHFQKFSFAFHITPDETG
jgi:hypothetical protein